MNIDWIIELTSSKRFSTENRITLNMMLEHQIGYNLKSGCLLLPLTVFSKIQYRVILLSVWGCFSFKNVLCIM